MARGGSFQVQACLELIWLGLTGYTLACILATMYFLGTSENEVQCHLIHCMPTADLPYVYVAYWRGMLGRGVRWGGPIMFKRPCRWRSMFLPINAGMYQIEPGGRVIQAGRLCWVTISSDGY
jgi:hypothetical protein